ncbi:MAG: hypothetical protein QNJ97_19545 [Myxococcota bacterium]|nr:hypothetical protein [Myxococcota bacterium]
MTFSGARGSIGSVVGAAVAMWVLMGSASASEPRIAVVATPTQAPQAREVKAVLAEHLFETGIVVTEVALDVLPQETHQWVALANKVASEEAGTIALVGYACGEKKCRLIAVDPKSDTVVHLPVAVPDHGDFDAAFAIAATAREVLLGPLMPELDRLAHHGANPSPPPPSPDSIWTKPPLEAARTTPSETFHPWLWVTGGYQGDHAHPDGQPNHGPFLGVMFEPKKSLGIDLSVGWLGFREANVSTGTVHLNRITAALALRVLFSLGPARVALAPIGRLDVVFAHIDPTAASTRVDVDLEVQAGGITTWHLPISHGLEAVVGAGVVASLVSRGYAIDTAETEKETAIPAPIMRLLWVAGIAWSPL